MHRLLAICAVGLGTGCSTRSEDDIRAEFDAFVLRGNRCAEHAECVVVTAGCPLSCWVAVHRENASAVSTKARELIEEYESGGRSCHADCVQHGDPHCQEGRCSVEPMRFLDGGTTQ